MTAQSPPLDDPEAFIAWLRSLDDDGLVDYRFEIYDRADVAPNAEGLRAALKFVCAIEREREWLREMRNLVCLGCPDVDSDAFASAVESGLNMKPVAMAEVLRGALTFGRAVRELVPTTLSAEC